MDAAPLLLSAVLLVSLAKGQLEADVQQPDLEYQSGQLVDDDQVLWKDYIPIQSAREKSFAEGLIMEAGMHVLFPEMYERRDDKEKSDLRLYEMKGQPEMYEQKENNVGLKFYEMKGQPEIEESYMNEKARRSKQNCPEHCPVYKPVCGSDGKVYESQCHLRKENCDSPSVTTGPWDVCRGKHYLCPSRCVGISDPVCGSDGRIYHNVCIMRKRNCGKLIDILPIRKCYENAMQSKDLAYCPEDCQETYKPACGSDGVIYYNNCFMRKRTCNRGIVEVDMEGCIEVPKCPEVCLPLHDPVCGSDGRLYKNPCRMFQENCGKEIKMMAKSFCGYVGKGPLPTTRRTD